jgi:hypothetical protein
LGQPFTRNLAFPKIPVARIVGWYDMELVCLRIGEQATLLIILAIPFLRKPSLSDRVKDEKRGILVHPC